MTRKHRASRFSGGVHRRGRRGNATIKRRSRRGWDMNLYRNTDNKKIAGVCAGLADHFEVAHWVVRLIAVAGLFFTGSLAIFCYCVGWYLMAPRREEYAEESVEYDEHRREFRPKHMFRYSEGAGTRLKTAQEKLRASRDRVEQMESYVTSRQYQLNREFSKLAD